jgi:ABC-type transport system involved in multi-copper enzyme maturation permease subunit
LLPLNSFALGAASEFWMTRWLTTFWLWGVGVTLGLSVLSLLIGLFYVLSKIPLFENLRKNGLAFWIGLVGAGVCTVITALAVKNGFRIENSLLSDEWLLFGGSLLPLFGIIWWALLYGGQRRFIGEFFESVTRGVGAYIAGVFLFIACGGLLATFLVDEPVAMLKSVPSLFVLGETTETFTVPVQDESDRASSKFFPLGLKYDPRFLSRIVVRSKQNVILLDTPVIETYSRKPVRIQAGEDLLWTRGSTADSPIPLVIGGNVYAQNLESAPAEITFTLRSAPPYPSMISVFVIAAGVILIGMAWIFQLSAAPRLAAIAISAAKNELSQPLPVILLLFGTLILISFVHLPYHTEGEDIKLLKDCGLTLILVICLFQGVWSSSSSVSEEIEGRTALTLMSKPIPRRSFILGKMLGIFWVVLFLVLFLGTIFLLTVAYKPIVDARESQLDTPLWQQCHTEAMMTLPGLIMVLLQATTLSSLSVALATRLPQLANFAVCLSIYLIGHLTPTIVEATSDAFPIVQFFAQLIAVVVPTLDWYSMDKAIDSGHGIPLVYLSGIFIYSILYTAVAVFLGLLLFEDRDLA